MSNESKKRLELSLGARVSVSWYPGTNTEELSQSIREALGVAPSARLVLRDAEGDVVTLSGALPSGLRLTVEVFEEARAPEPPSSRSLSRRVMWAS